MIRIQVMEHKCAPHIQVGHWLNRDMQQQIKPVNRMINQHDSVANCSEDSLQLPLHVASQDLSRF